MNRFNRSLIRLLFVPSLSLLLFLPTRLRCVHAQNESSYELAVMKNEMVAMRDGVKLATNIYRLARNGSAVDGKFPVILGAHAL